jgi:hypothetical protein
VDEHADQDVQVVGLVRRDDALGDAILHRRGHAAVQDRPAPLRGERRLDRKPSGTVSGTSPAAPAAGALDRQLGGLVVVLLDLGVVRGFPVDEHADQDVQKYNYEATKLSIERAIKGTPTAAEVTQQYKTAQHSAAVGVPLMARSIDSLVAS